MQQDKATSEISHNVSRAADVTRTVVAVLDEVTHAANATRGVADTVLAASDAVDAACDRSAEAHRGLSCRAWAVYAATLGSQLIGLANYEAMIPVAGVRAAEAGTRDGTVVVAMWLQAGERSNVQ